MPRITGPDIATHVAQQEAAVVEAAVHLFATRGFADVTMSDIAEAVGLARTSLYRYFPDKDHILLRWLGRVTDELVRRSEAIASDERPAAERLAAWLDLQLDYVSEPEHRLFTDIASSLGDLSAEVRAEIGAQHRRLYATAESIVGDGLRASRRRRDAHLVTTLLLGMFRAAAVAVAEGVDDRPVRRELHRAAVALLEG